MYHITTCLPYNNKNHDIKRVSNNLGFVFINTPKCDDELSYNSYCHFAKLELSLRAIQKNEEIKNSVVMFTDAHDVIVLMHASVIEARFKKLDCDFCVSGEGFFWPNNEEYFSYRNDVKKYFEKLGEGKHPYPNTGCWIGYGWAAEKILERGIEYAKKHEIYDDQQIIQDIMYWGKVSDINIKVDSDQTIFSSLINNLENLYLCGSQVYSSSSRAEIGAIHFNGFSNEWRQFIRFYNEVFLNNLEFSINLKILKHPNGKYLCYNDMNFYFDDDLSQSILFLLETPAGNCAVLRPDGKVFSFSPDGAYSIADCQINSWETKKKNDMIKTLQLILSDDIISHSPTIKEIVESKLVYIGDFVKTSFYSMF